MDFVVIDFEKLNDSLLSVCEVGIVEYINGKEVNSIHSYINPVNGLERNKWAQEHLNHITNEMLINAPSYNEIFTMIHDFIQDKLLVCHNKGADLNYIYKLGQHYNLPKLYSRWLDTQEVYNKGLESIYFLCFDEKMPEHHKALEDARACGKVFDYISSRKDISQFIHNDYYTPSTCRNGSKSDEPRHTRFGTANVEPDGLVFNHDKISDCSFFKGKTVALSGMSGNDKNKIDSILKDLGARRVSSLSSKTNVFIIDKHKVGATKRVTAIELQKENGLLVISDEYFMEISNVMIQPNLFTDIDNIPENPLTNRRIGFIGNFKNRAALIRKVKEFGASDNSKEGITRDTQILVMGRDIKQKTLNRLLCYEHDGWKPLKISEAELEGIFKGNYDGYKTPPAPIKHISMDMSYYYWTPPVYTDDDDDEDDSGIRRSSPLVYGENNPIYGMEIYVPDWPNKDMRIIRQLIGNVGGFANTEYFDDTNVIMLSEETLRLLEQGFKDDIIIDIENTYNISSAMVFNIQFTSETDFISWIKKRLEKFPDKSTLALLEKYLG